MSFYSPPFGSGGSGACPVLLTCGGLGADVSAYNGLVSIVGGASYQVNMGSGMNFDLLTKTLSASVGSIDVSQNGFLIATRPELDFKDGIGTTANVTDDVVNNEADVSFDIEASLYSSIINMIQDQNILAWFGL